MMRLFLVVFIVTILTILQNSWMVYASDNYTTCVPYSGFGNANKTLCAFQVCEPGWVTISACIGSQPCTEDTFFELYDINMNLLDENDDRCGVCSEISVKYRPSQPSLCSTYYIMQGCYPGTPCSATTKIYNGVVISNPTIKPTPFPTFRPTATSSPTVRPPTRQPTGLAFGNSNSTRQREILMEFYRALRDPVNGWKDARRWGTQFPLYRWRGVTVDNNGDVIRISLNNNNLYGTIPESIGELTGLVDLTLSYNSIFGRIPASIGNLTNLGQLNLQFNLLTGSVPNIFAKMSKLSTIQLAFNYLTGSVNPLLNISQLSVAQLFNNRFSGTISSKFCDISTLTALLAFHNDFTCYEPCVSISGASIDYLTSENYPVCRGGYQDKALCELGGPDGVSSTLSNIQNIEYSRSFGPRYVKNKTHDDFFYFNYHASSFTVDFSDDVVLGDLRDVSNYFLFYFELNIYTSADGITYDNHHYTLPDFPGVFNTPPFVSNLPFLRMTLSIFFDPFFASSLLRVPGYSFKVIMTLPQNLQTWDCGSSSLTIRNPCGWYGITCTGNALVTGINLAGLGIGGSIPSSIGTLSALVNVDLSNNDLIGTLPTYLGLLKNLQTFYVSNNFLESTIPTSLASVTTLVALRVDSNLLTGPVPDYLSSLTNLQSLQLQANSFAGKIPSSLCSLNETNIRLDSNADLTCYEGCDGLKPIHMRLSTSVDFCSPTSQPTSVPTHPTPFPTGPHKSNSLKQYRFIIGLVFVCASVVILAGVWAYRLRKIEIEYHSLPIHLAVVRNKPITTKLYEQYKDTIRTRDRRGKTVMDLVLERIHNYSISAEWLVQLVEDSMHFDRETGEPLDEEEHGFAWAELVQYSDDNVLGAVQQILKDYLQFADLLAFGLDRHGRRCIDIASARCRDEIHRSLWLHQKFELKAGPPEHVSSTSLVKFASMHTKDSEVVEAPIRVALKFMKHRSQFETEVAARVNSGFSAQYVIMVLATFDGDSEDPEDVAFCESARYKGFGEYPYCVVMDVAEMSLQRLIFHENIAAKDWDKIRKLTKSLAGCLAHIHGKGITHGDLKPMNIVVVGSESVRLIDFDASCPFGDIEFGYAGEKWSSAYLPPEMIFEKSENNFQIKSFTRDPVTGEPVGVQRVREENTGNEILYHPAGYSLVRASPYQDMWALGAVLYLLCTGVNLFPASVEDNIPQSELGTLYHWTNATKEAKLSAVHEKYARNLISLLLSTNPKHRLDPSRIISHPFISGAQPSRLQGEEAKFDVFLSYRVDSDAATVNAIYDALTAIGLSVWWDQRCLLPGQPWEEGFCEGLVNSSYFVCVLSRNAINNREKAWQNIRYLEATSRCDNVLLEWRLALELRARNMIEGIFPVFVGDSSESSGSMGLSPISSVRDRDRDSPIGEFSDYFSSGCHPSPIPDVIVASIETKLREHLNTQGLGLPMETSRSVAQLVSDITANQGGFIRGKYDEAIEDVCNNISQMTQKAMLMAPKSPKTQLSFKLTAEQRNDFLLAENFRLREESNRVAILAREIEKLNDENERLVAECKAFEALKRDIRRMKSEYADLKAIEALFEESSLPSALVTSSKVAVGPLKRRVNPNPGGVQDSMDSSLETAPGPSDSQDSVVELSLPAVNANTSSQRLSSVPSAAALTMASLISNSSLPGSNEYNASFNGPSVQPGLKPRKELLGRNRSMVSFKIPDDSPRSEASGGSGGSPHSTTPAITSSGANDPKVTSTRMRLAPDQLRIRYTPSTKHFFADPVLPPSSESGGYSLVGIEGNPNVSSGPPGALTSSKGSRGSTRSLRESSSSRNFSGNSGKSKESGGGVLSYLLRGRRSPGMFLSSSVHGNTSSSSARPTLRNLTSLRNVNTRSSPTGATSTRTFGFEAEP